MEQLLIIIELESYKSEIFNIPAEHKAGIEEGLKHIKEGSIKSQEEVLAKYKTWR